MIIQTTRHEISVNDLERVPFVVLELRSKPDLNRAQVITPTRRPRVPPLINRAFGVDVGLRSDLAIGGLRSVRAVGLKAVRLIIEVDLS
jgi:hypothetical protein